VTLQVLAQVAEAGDTWFLRAFFFGSRASPQGVTIPELQGWVTAPEGRATPETRRAFASQAIAPPAFLEHDLGSAAL
jgi:hypothetical protein